MKTISTIILFILGITFCYGIEIKPSSHGRYDYITKEYTLNKDGSMTYTYSSSLELLTYDAFHKLYGESFIVYNPLYQTLKINKAVTIMRDGKRIESPTNAFNEVLPSFCANAPAYNNLREMVVSHTGLEVGAKIDFSYTLTTSKEYEKPICERITFAELSPVNKYTVTVKVPKSITLYWEQLNVNEKPVKTTGKDFDVYTWTLTNLPAISKEQNSLAYMMDYPSVAFSTIQLVSDYYVMSDTPNESIHKITDNIKITDTELVKATAIANYIANNINTNYIPLSFQNKTIKTPDEVIATNSGTAIEKANLLAAVLNYEGIDNDIAISIPNKYYTNAITNTGDISEIFVVIEDENKKPYVLSPIRANNDVNSNLNNFSIIAITPTAKKNIAFKRDKTAKFVYAKFNSQLNDHLQMDGTATITLKDASIPSNYSPSKPESILPYISGVISKATCTDFKSVSKTDVSVSFKYEQNDSVNLIASGYKSISLPIVQGGIDDFHINILAEERTKPYMMPQAVTEQYEYSFDIPESIKVLNNNVKIENKYDFGSILIEYKADKNRLTIKRSIIITSETIIPQQYKAFVSMINLWNNPHYRTVYFK